MAREQGNRGTESVAFGSYEGTEPRYRGMTTHSTYIPMRDGVRLAVDVILPRSLPPETRIPARGTPVLTLERNARRASRLELPTRPAAIDALTSRG